MALTKVHNRMVAGAVNNVLDYGADPTGFADSTSAIQAALNAGVTYIPTGTYRVTSSLLLPSATKVYGDGRRDTIINSEVIGDSLFKPNGEIVFCYIADMKLQGNNLTGASGNGHAINFIDPSAGGAFSPQNSVIERLEINGFRGQDIRERGVSTTICAAAIIMFDTLQNVVNEVLAQQCGHSFFMYTTQNCRITNSLAVEIDKYALFALNNENLIVDKCDLLSAGDGIVDPGYPSSPIGFDSGIVLSSQNQNFVLSNTKLKNIAGGSSVIRSIQSDNDTYSQNWIRASSNVDAPHKGIYAQHSYNIQIVQNTFHPSTTPFARKYQQVHLYNTLTHDTMTARIEGNTFGDVSASGIEYNILLEGNASTRSFSAYIGSNSFGFNSARASATTVDYDIKINNCLIEASQIQSNLFIASTNVTRSACVFASSITDTNNQIGPNRFSSNGGTITAEYSGIQPSKFYGSKLYNIGSIANASRETTNVTVTGASLSAPNFVSVGYSKDILGLNVWGYVSATNTVTVVFENNTGGTVDPDSGGLAIVVTRWPLSAI